MTREDKARALLAAIDAVAERDERLQHIAD
jgi:hypothetical protein